ncbi:DUF655 domain-containing protein, partial [Methanoregula sp.]|uniref:DUF655 domain-containing protein n=1 Tax=Methanoregula sp. TaxID=2052170 RepID=UPI000CABFCFE
PHLLHRPPGIGEKLMGGIVASRNQTPFENCADISARIKEIPHQEQMVQARILEELQDKETKYHLFTTK